VLNILLLALAGGVVIFVVSTLVVLCCAEAVGNTYRSLPAAIRRELRSATLYHYCDAAFVDQFVDAATGSVTLRRRARTLEPYLTSRRALYLYTAHSPRGAKTNHPKHWRSAAAVITISGADLLNAVGDAKL
jgi:hypothetical protein